jgi:hypothetical protein
VLAEFLTELKKVFVSVSMAPSATPLLLYVRILPFVTTSIWVGPTAPIALGGYHPESVKVGPRKFVPTD